MTTTMRYVEFRVFDEDRFQILTRFTQLLKLRPEAQTAEAEDATRPNRLYVTPEEWLLALRPADLVGLGMPDHATALTAIKAWQGLSRAERRAVIKKEAPLQILADFVDLIKHISLMRFRLVGCSRVGRDTARLDFESDEVFFTERDTLEALLLFFGFFNITAEGF